MNNLFLSKISCKLDIYTNGIYYLQMCNMKKRFALTVFILVLTMYTALVFALDQSQDNRIILINDSVDNITTNVTNEVISNSTDIAVIIAPPVNLLTNIFYGGTRMQTETNSKSKYTNGYSKPTSQISHGGDRVQTETNSKSKYTNGYN